MSKLGEVLKVLPVHSAGTSCQRSLDSSDALWSYSLEVFRAQEVGRKPSKGTCTWGHSVIIVIWKFAALPISPSFMFLCIPLWMFDSVSVTAVLISEYHFLFLCFDVVLLVWASLVAQMVKNLPVMWETWVQTLGPKIPWRREWQPTPIFLPGEFHGQRSQGEFHGQKTSGLQSMGSQRVGNSWTAHTFTCLENHSIIPLGQS